MTHSKEWNGLPEAIKVGIENLQTQFPVPLGRIAQFLGIKVKSSTLPAGISGEIREVEGECVIKVNRHDVKARQRFTVAHEIAHFLLHRDRISEGIVDDVLYRSSLSNALEAQANRLGADLILPWNLLNGLMEQLSDLRGEALYEALAGAAEVSTTVIKIRLGKI